MSEAGTHMKENNEPQLTKIRIKGHLADRWADWFAELTITREANGATLLSGPVPDQAALYGLLRKVRDLGLPLLTVNWVDPSPADLSDVKPQSIYLKEEMKNEYK